MRMLSRLRNPCCHKTGDMARLAHALAALCGLLASNSTLKPLRLSSSTFLHTGAGVAAGRRCGVPGARAGSAVRAAGKHATGAAATCRSPAAAAPPAP